MSRYEEIRHSTNWGNALPMAIRRKEADFKWYESIKLGFWAKLGLWLRGKL